MRKVITQSWMGPYESAWEQPYGPYPKGYDEIAMMTGLGASPTDIALLDPGFARADFMELEETETFSLQDSFASHLATTPRLPPQKPIPQALRSNPNYMKILEKLSPAATCLLDMKQLGTTGPGWKVPPKGCESVWVELHKMIPAEYHMALVNDLAWYVQQKLKTGGQQPPEEEGTDIGKLLLWAGLASGIGLLLFSKKK